MKYSEVNIMLLFPDMRRTQHEAQEFCFCSPCTTAEWRRLMTRAKKETTHAERKRWLKFCFVQDDDEKVCIIPWPDNRSEDDVLSTAAYIRMVREFTGMIYAVPSCGQTMESKSMAAIIARTAGVPKHQVRHVEV